MRIEGLLLHKWFVAQNHKGALFHGQVLDIRPQKLTVMLYGWKTVEPSVCLEFNIDSMAHWHFCDDRHEMELTSAALVEEQRQYPNRTIGNEALN